MKSVPAPTALASLWPFAIIAWFVLFISGLATWAVVAVRQDVDLVRPDYYEEEIRYQKQIDRLERTAAFRNEVSITYHLERREVALRLPEAHAAGSLKGVIHFYRPSDARLDFERPMSLDSHGMQRVDTTPLRAGLWKVRVQWTADGREYYFDQKLVL